jgi:uncharacterized protein YuzE
MKVTYFHDTDTLYIEFSDAESAETRDLDENTLIDFDRDGNVCALTLEHAKDRTDVSQVVFEEVAA